MEGEERRYLFTSSTNTLTVRDVQSQVRKRIRGRKRSAEIRRSGDYIASRFGTSTTFSGRGAVSLVRVNALFAREKEQEVHQGRE